MPAIADAENISKWDKEKQFTSKSTASFSITMDGIVDGEPARDDRGGLAAQEWVDVDVNLPDCVIGTVGVMVQHCDLQRLILQVLVVNLTARNGCLVLRWGGVWGGVCTNYGALPQT